MGAIKTIKVNGTRDIFVNLEDKGYKHFVPGLDSEALYREPTKLGSIFSHDWGKQSERVTKYYKIKEVDEFWLECLKCQDQSTSLTKSCPNCNFSFLTIPRAQVLTECRCDRNHPQFHWVCDKCGCKNPLDSTVFTNIHLDEVKDPTSKSGGCFIATACYGDYDAPEVIALRYFRDDTLLKTFYGKLVVRCYYVLSPPIAKIILKFPSMKRLIVSILLNPIVSKISYNKTCNKSE